MSDKVSIRASCWSITINNPPDVIECNVPGWKLDGQLEKGESGTTHFQGMLKTPQVRWSAVKSQFPTAHIEKAVNPKALAKYVKKEETRVGDANISSVMNMFQLQEFICQLFSWRELSEWCGGNGKDTKAYECKSPARKKELFMEYIDHLTERAMTQHQIMSAEFISINPMWRSSWLRFGPIIIMRYDIKNKRDTLSIEDDSETP